MRGEAPAFDTPDEDVYIEGRNIVLLSKAAVFMARAGISRVLIGPLAGNPFPDATPEFFDAMARALSIGLAAPIAIEAPFADAAQGGRDPAGPLAGRAAGADAVVHAAARAACTAAGAANAGSGGMRFERRGARIRRNTITNH